VERAVQKEGFKLAFSGGGFRATFYCLGAYRRLVELGIDSSVTSISSVSGGRIAAGMIMTALSNGSFEDIDDFDKRVTEPLKRLGQLNLRKTCKAL
jgi:NTE family protein